MHNLPFPSLVDEATRWVKGRAANITRDDAQRLLPLWSLHEALSEQDRADVLAQFPEAAAESAGQPEHAFSLRAVEDGSGFMWTCAGCPEWAHFQAKDTKPNAALMAHLHGDDDA